MKKKLLLIIALLGWQLNAHAADLIEVYNQALGSDAIFQQAIDQSLVTRENVPISVAAILPNLTLTANPTVSRLGFSGTQYAISSFNNINAPRNLTERTYTMSLTLTQPVFNASLFSNIAMELQNAKGACATLNAALQSLMVRVASAYFAILKDEDNLSYAEANKRNYAQQLDQSRKQYQVGLKTLTDVYTAQASYDTARSDVIAAETTLANDRENLRVITGVYYPELAALKEDFPLLTPEPNNVDDWVKTSIAQNWTIRAAEYSVNAAKENVREQNAGHLPTVTLQAAATRSYQDNIDRYRAFIDRTGPGTTSDRSIGLNINFPLFSGGGVVAKTRQAAFNFQMEQQVLEQTIRTTVNTTRQSYMNLIAGISKIEADKQAIKSAISSYEGMVSSYNVGTETLMDVLNQQANVYQAQTNYATDRYAFVNNIILLKQSAGTLGYDDLLSINAWLGKKRDEVMREEKRKRN